MIPGVVVHPRSDWEDPNYPVTAPAPRGTAGTWVIHYPAGNAEPRADAEVIAYLQAIQRSYLSSRGYSIGYSLGVSQSGSAWEIRGMNANPASNPGRKVEGNFNNVSRSIFVMVKGDDPATPEAVATINAIIATEPTWDVITHGDVDYTSCCGAGMIAQVRNGTIGQQQPEPPTPVPPTTGDYDMLYIAKPVYAGTDANTPWLAVFESGQIRRALNADVSYAQTNGVSIIDQDSREQHEYAIAKFGV